jgi:hypothetical protein
VALNRVFAPLTDVIDAFVELIRQSIAFIDQEEPMKIQMNEAQMKLTMNTQDRIIISTKVTGDLIDMLTEFIS